VRDDPAALDRVVKALRGVDGESDALSIAETIWLAAHRAPGPAQPETAPGPDTGTGAGAVSQVTPEPAGPPAREPPAPAALARARRPRRDRELHQAVAAARPPVRGQAVRAPRGHALPRSLDLGRSMRPLKRRWCAGWRHELDMAATVDGYARSLELIPVFRPAPERWFELFVIVDRSASMAVWQQTVAELTDVLRKTGAFRKLHVWDLHPDEDGAVLRGPRGQVLAPGQLGAPGGRRLAVVISDCSAAGWRNGGAWQLLRDWSRAVTTALVNPLPTKLWRHTGLDLPAIRVGPPDMPGAPSAALAHHVPMGLESPVASGTAWVPVPALALTPYSLGRWARTVMREDGRGCDAVLIPGQALFQQIRELEYDDAQPGSGTEDIVDTFLHMASPRAVRLAALCTRLPEFTLALLDIIRAELVPEADVTDAAEVVMSGLFVIEPADRAGTVLRFRDGVPARLRTMLSAHDVGRLIDVLSDYVARHAGLIPGFPAAVADPRGDIDFRPDPSPFARVGNETLESMGSGPWRLAPGDSGQTLAAIAAIVAARGPHLRTLQDLCARLEGLAAALAAAGERRAELLADAEPGVREQLMSWERPLRDLARDVTAEQEASGDLLKRFARPTLNIAVAGRARHGKSRFLRSLTGLAAVASPDGQDGGPPEVPVLITHRPDGHAHADVFFHSAASFLEEVINPIYRRLGLGLLPASLESFGRRPLPGPPQGISRVDAYADLVACHRGFPEYHHLVGTPSPRRIGVDELAEFTTRMDTAGRPRYLYLAVRQVHVIATLPHAGLPGLGFVDLPGREEENPDDAPAPAALRHDTDLVLFVRRPDLAGDAIEDGDLGLYYSAAKALPPVPMERQSFLILNHVRSPVRDNLDQARSLRDQVTSSAMRVAGVAIADCSSPEEVHGAFGPVLDHLTSHVADLDQLLTREEGRRVGELRRRAYELAEEMSGFAAGRRWSEGLTALKSAGDSSSPSGTQPRSVAPGRVQVPAGSGETPVYLIPPRSGTGTDAATTDIVLWGAPGSGKATYVAALPHALNQAGASAGRWVLHPLTETATATLINWTHQMVNEGSFPTTTGIRDPTELVWRCVGDLTGSQYVRRGRFRRRSRTTSRLDLALLDVSGQVFGHDARDRRLPSGFADMALQHLARAQGLVYLFDPVGDHDGKAAAEYVNRTLTMLSRTVMAEGRLIGLYLPHYVAVCITKLDHPEVFRWAREAGLVNYGPDGMPRVLDRHAGDLFDAICQGEFRTYQRTDGPSPAVLVRNLLRRYFHPDRIRYYAVSSIGYRKPPGWGDRATERPGFMFDPDDFSNVTERDGERRIRGPVEPVNVIEPLIELQMQITGRR